MQLGGTEEQLYPLGPLSLPVGDVEGNPDLARQSEAVQLFCLHARRVRPDFTPTPHDYVQISGICARLEGLPLAIELAAAQCDTWGISGLAAHLDDALPRLVREDPNVPERHRTMSDAIRWSYQLLSLEAQRLLRRLAVFAGGFTEEAAVQVCAGGDLHQEEVPLLLATLIRASLLVVDRRGRSDRYRFHELIRQFAAGLLDPKRQGAPATVPADEPEAEEFGARMPPGMRAGSRARDHSSLLPGS